MGSAPTPESRLGKCEGMKLDRVFRGFVNLQGELKLEDSIGWRGFLLHLKGKRVGVTVKPERKHRTLQANAYYWKVVLGLIAEWSGHEREEVHDAMKEKFLSRTTIDFPGGKRLVVSPSTAELDTVEFQVYLDRVKRWAAEQGLNIPDPNEVEVTL